MIWTSPCQRIVLMAKTLFRHIPKPTTRSDWGFMLILLRVIWSLFAENCLEQQLLCWNRNQTRSVLVGDISNWHTWATLIGNGGILLIKNLDMKFQRFFLLGAVFPMAFLNALHFFGGQGRVELQRFGGIMWDDLGLEDVRIKKHHV